VLSGTPDAPRFRGRVTWREARLGLRELDLLDGEVEVAPRAVTATRLTLRIGQTVARVHGTVTAPGDKPLRALDPLQDIRLDVAGEVPTGRTADIVEYLPDGLDIQGSFRMQGRVSGPLRAIRGEASLQMADLRTWREVWDRGQAVLILDAGAVTVRQISVHRGGAHVTGEVHERDGSLRGRFDGEALELDRMQWLAKTGLAGRATASAELSGLAREPRVQGRARCADLRFQGVRFGAAEADFGVAGRRAVEVDVTSGGRRVRLGIDLMRDTLEGTLIARDGDLLPLLQLAGGSGDGLQLRGTGQAAFQGPLGDLPSGEGWMNFGHLQLRARGEAWDTHGDAKASWRGKVLTLDPLRLRSGERDLVVQGRVMEGPQADLTVRGEMPLTAGAALLAGLTPSAGLARVDLGLSGPLFTPVVRGQVTVHGGVLGIPGLPVPLREVEAVVTLEPGQTRVPSWRGRLADGAARGTAEVVHGGEGWSMATAFAVEGARADEVLSTFRGKEEVTGTLSLTGTLSSHGAGPGDFWPGLSGRMNVLMRDGYMGPHTILARLLSLLNVAQVLSLRIPDLLSTGMPYQQLTADVAIQDGVARTENLVLDTPAMKVNAVGDVRLVEETVDLQVGVKPFQTVDIIITKIPIAGWLLGGRERGLIVATFHVTGPLQDPVVTPMPLRDVGRNVFGIFRRILELPEALTAPFENMPPQPVRPPESTDR
jgi:hypothetical protein